MKWLMMVYFDTNVLIYAFAKNIDDINQGEIATKLLTKAISTNTLIISEVILCEFAFVSSKIEETKENIDDNLEFLSFYLRESNLNISPRILSLLRDTNLYKSSFDIYHLAFAEYYNASLITFDKGFKKLKPFSKVEIIIK